MLGFLFKRDKKDEKDIETIKEKVNEEKEYLPISSQPQNTAPGQLSTKDSSAPTPKGEVMESQKPLSPPTFSQENLPSPQTTSQNTNTPEEKKIEDLFSPTPDNLVPPSQDVEKTHDEGENKDAVVEQPLAQDIKEPSPPQDSYSKDVEETFREVPTPQEENVLLQNLTTQKVISPPLFISVRKYREIVNELVSLKVSITTLESVLDMTKRGIEADRDHVRNFIDELEKINHRMKYFSEIFKLK